MNHLQSPTQLIPVLLATYQVDLDVERIESLIGRSLEPPRISVSLQLEIVGEATDLLEGTPE